MKKIQVIFAATALVLASAAVFAGTFANVETYWKHTSNSAACSGIQVSQPSCEIPVGTACEKIVEEGGLEVTYRYSRLIMTDANPPVFVSCDQYKKLVGTNPILP
jgi:hypothetical protein